MLCKFEQNGEFQPNTGAANVAGDARIATVSPSFAGSNIRNAKVRSNGHFPLIRFFISIHFIHQHMLKKENKGQLIYALRHKHIHLHGAQYWKPVKL